MRKLSTKVLLVAALIAIGCGGSTKDDGGAPGVGGGGTGSINPMGGAGASGAGVGTGNAGTDGGGAGTGSAAGTGGGAGTGVDTSTVEAMFPEVTDWKALELVYPVSYSAFDGKHVFKVPMRARCTKLPLEAWHAVPASAVTFDADPDNENGVMITVVEGTPEITIVAVNGTLGGTAPLHITVGTPEQWELGNQRYNNGSDWMLDLLMPKAPPPDTKCTVCHSDNSSTMFNVQHTPTQAARISDDGIKQIMTTGTKPADVPFRVIPDSFMFGTMTLTNVELYMMFHLWEASDDQIKGMILYLRSLTPKGQGCVTNPQNGMCTDVMDDPNAECQ